MEGRRTRVRLPVNTPYLGFAVACGGNGEQTVVRTDKPVPARHHYDALAFRPYAGIDHAHEHAARWKGGCKSSEEVGAGMGVVVWRLMQQVHHLLVGRMLNQTRLDLANVGIVAAKVSEEYDHESLRYSSTECRTLVQTWQALKVRSRDQPGFT